MIEVLCNDMFSKNLVTRACAWWVSYDYKSLEACPNYDGPVSLDFYGRLHPKHSNGTVKLGTLTNNLQLITAPMVRQFDEKTDHRLLYRRLGVCAVDVSEDIGMYQVNMFVDYEAGGPAEIRSECRLQRHEHAGRRDNIRAKYADRRPQGVGLS